MTTTAASPRTGLRSALLDRQTWLRWGFTGRVAGMGRADGNVSYSGGRDRDDAWEMRRQWLAPLGLDAERIVSTGQVHGTSVLRVDAPDSGRGARPDSPVAGIADAMMTDVTGPVLFSLHADCLPILLADPVHRAVAVVHAGWRGTVTDVAGSAVRAMEEAYGSDPVDLFALLGPAMAGADYEVGPEVVDAWVALAGAPGPAAWPGRGDRWQFDTATANRDRLVSARLRPEHIEASRVCTYRGADQWFSHRAQGPTTGRFAAIVTITEALSGTDERSGK